ncbi:hypothetical protein [Leekyejoonella antrihumi]|uniref:Peptidase S51 n=1 Tax=Leekyejoonella antrihumi TaxID=1660198 RepID=A0A563E7R2_9MICO|nr:hypothetical protein [Leekyejoonella antrihumi]TWP38242.1 hypothetical protein FGL98_03205 [Leekyejoonella antrihumi]
MSEVDEGAVPRITLLGPQRRPSLDKVVQAMGLAGPFATITAGWQEREFDDAELHTHLRGDSHNLSLWHRLQDVLAQDADLAVAHRIRRDWIAQLQELYLIGVDHTMRAVRQIREQTENHPQVLAMAVADAEEVLRDLDRRHLARVHAVHAEFYERLVPHERPVVAHHRGEVAEVLSRCNAVVLAGGHVAELLDALHLFNIAPAGLDRLPIIAWSAGAMALTERVVLFNDNASREPTWSEVYDGGMGVLRDMVLLPSAHYRLRMQDHGRMSTFAHRFAPARCVLLDPGAKVQVGYDGRLPAYTPVIGSDGRTTTLGEARDA